MEYKMNVTIYFEVEKGSDAIKTADDVQNWIESMLDRHENTDPKTPSGLAFQFYDNVEPNEE